MNWTDLIQGRLTAMAGDMLLEGTPRLFTMNGGTVERILRFSRIATAQLPNTDRPGEFGGALAICVDQAHPFRTFFILQERILQASMQV